MPGSAEVIKNMYRWAALKQAGLEGLGRVVAANMQAYARMEARWTDRTGNARQGLNGGIIRRGEGIIAYIAHSMEYGIFLELCNDGKYAILEETRDKFKEEAYRQADRIMKM